MLNKIVVFYLLLLALLSCMNKSNSTNNSFLDIPSEIDMEIVSKRIVRGGALLNDNINIIPNNKLVSQKPMWLKEDSSRFLHTPKDYVFKPRLSDIEPPYFLRKSKNDKYVYIYKYKDTLKFEMWDINEKDPNDPTFLDLWESLND